MAILDLRIFVDWFGGLNLRAPIFFFHSCQVEVEGCEVEREIEFLARVVVAAGLPNYALEFIFFFLCCLTNPYEIE